MSTKTVLDGLVEAQGSGFTAEDWKQCGMDGDFPGHPFRGNKYVSGHAGSAKASSASRRAKGSGSKAHHSSAASLHAKAAAATSGTTKAYHQKMGSFHAKMAK